MNVFRAANIFALLLVCLTATYALSNSPRITHRVAPITASSAPNIHLISQPEK